MYQPKTYIDFVGYDGCPVFPGINPDVGCGYAEGTLTCGVKHPGPQYTRLIIYVDLSNDWWWTVDCWADEVSYTINS